MIEFGMDRATFREEYFEKKPFFKKASFDPRPFGWRLIDNALDRQEPSRELLKVLKEGRVEPAVYVEEYIDIGIRRKRIFKDRLYKLLTEGATVVLNRVEVVSPPALDFCLEVGRFIGAQTTSNAYASLGEIPATSAHWDTHDVFVIQISGRKHWKVFEPTLALPVSNQISDNHREDAPDLPWLDEVVEAGDILYVPRGWWHRVVPVSGDDSVHLTIAVHTPLILDYLIWACSTILPEEIDLRHSLVGEQHDAARVTAAAATIARALQSPDHLNAFYVRCHERERVVSRFNVQGLIKDAELPLDDRARVLISSRHASANSWPFIIHGRPYKSDGIQAEILKELASTVVLEVGEIRSRFTTVPRSELDAILRELAVADVIRIDQPEGLNLDVLDCAA